MPNGEPWSEDDIETMVSMYLKNATAREIGDVLGRKVATVRSMISVIRRKRNLPSREDVRYNAKTVFSDYDIAYRGPVELGHWMITKPWRQKGERK